MAYSANFLKTSFFGCPLSDADYSSTYLRSLNSTFTVPTIIPALEPLMSLSTSQPFENLGYSPCRLTILSAGEAVLPCFNSCRRSSLVRPRHLFSSSGLSGAMQASLLTGYKFARRSRVVVCGIGARSAGAVHGSRARRLKPRRKMKVEGDEKNVAESRGRSPVAGDGFEVRGYEDMKESEWDIAEVALQQRERYMQEAAMSDRSNGTAHSSSGSVAEESSQEFRASDSNGAAVAQESAGLKDSDLSSPIDLSEHRSAQSGMQDSPSNRSMTGSESGSKPEDWNTIRDSIRYDTIRATPLQEHKAFDALLLRVDDIEEKEVRTHASRLENPITDSSGFEEQERSDEGEEGGEVAADVGIGEGSHEGADAMQDWWEEWDEGERPPGPMTKREYERQLRRHNLAERDLQKEEKTMVRQELVEHRKAHKEANEIDRRSQKVAKMQSRKEHDEEEEAERRSVGSAEKLARKENALKEKMAKREVQAVKDNVNSAQLVPLVLLALSPPDSIAEPDADVYRQDKTEEGRAGVAHPGGVRRLLTETSESASVALPFSGLQPFSAKEDVSAASAGSEVLEGGGPVVWSSIEASKPISEEVEEEEEEVHRGASHTGSTSEGTVGGEGDGVKGRSSESQAAVGDRSGPLTRQKQAAAIEMLPAASTAGTAVTRLGAVVAAEGGEVISSGVSIPVATIVALDSTNAAVPASEGLAAEERGERGPLLAAVEGWVEEVPPPSVKETTEKVTAGAGSVGGMSVALDPPEEGMRGLAERVSEGMSQMADSVSDSVDLVTSTVSKTVALVADSMQDTVSDLTYTVQHLSCSVQDTVHDLSESVQESVQGLSDSVSDTVADITESLEDAVTEVQDSVSDVTDKVSETVQELTGSREYDDDDDEDEFDAFKPPDTPEFKGIKGLDNFVVKQEDHGLVAISYDFYTYMIKQPLPIFSLALFFTPVFVSLVFTLLYLPDLHSLALDETAQKFFNIERMARGEGSAEAFGLDYSWYTLFQVFAFSLSLATGLQPELSPLSAYSLLVANMNALVAELVFVFLSGAVFARLSQPTQPVRCSKVALICAPSVRPRYRVESACSVLMCRYVLAGPQPCELVDVKVDLMLRYNTVTRNGSHFRAQQSLKLVRPEIAYQTHGMLVRHIIDDTSPLLNRSSDLLKREDAILSLSVVGLERTSMQSIFHVQHYSFFDGHIIWNAEFEDMVLLSKKNRRIVDQRKVSDYRLT